MNFHFNFITPLRIIIVTMSKVQNNSSYYQGRYIQLFDEKTRNRQKVSTSSTQHLFHFQSNANSPQKLHQKQNFQTQSLSIDEQLKKMTTNHSKIMEMMEGNQQIQKSDTLFNGSPKGKYDNFNPEKYLDSQLLSGRKQKSMEATGPEYKNSYERIGLSKQNIESSTYSPNSFNKFPSTEPKILQIERLHYEMPEQRQMRSEPYFQSSFDNFNKPVDVGIKKQVQYYSYYDQAPRLRPSSQNSAQGSRKASRQRINTFEIQPSIPQHNSRPFTQYIRMPQSFHQQFPQFFTYQTHPQQPIIVQNQFQHPQIFSQQQMKLKQQIQPKPTSPELIVNRPSIPRVPRATLGSHKKLSTTYSKPNIRQRSNSRDKKLNLSINSINNSNYNNNSRKSVEPRGSIERPRRPSTGGGLTVTLMRKPN